MTNFNPPLISQKREKRKNQHKPKLFTFLFHSVSAAKHGPKTYIQMKKLHLYWSTKQNGTIIIKTSLIYLVFLFLCEMMGSVSLPSSVNLDGEYLFKRGYISDHWIVLLFCALKMEN